MATVGYNGDGTKPFPTGVSVVSGVAGTPVGISAVANTSPIEVTTTAPHGFNTSDTIEQGNTGGVADGLFQITKVDATHYLLNGTTANGTASAGYAIDYEVQPGFQIPSPADPASMVTLAPVLQGLANAIPFLYLRTGTFRLYNVYFAGNNSFSSVNKAAAASYTLAQNGALLLAANFPGGLPIDLLADDLLEFELSSPNWNCIADGGSGAFTSTMAIGVNFAGAGYVPLSLCEAYNSSQGSSTTISNNVPLVLRGWALGGLTGLGTFTAGLMYKSTATVTTGNNSVSGQVQFTCKHYRVN